MGNKLSKLKEDLLAAKTQQEGAMELTLKCTRKEQPLEFNCKGHQEQFLFNETVKDNIAADTRQLGKLEPSDCEKAAVEKAKEEL